jgi:hypothetical protein
MFELDWLRQAAHGRAVQITTAGAQGLERSFGVRLS